ncbi:hypothetical protein CAAN3_03S05116 [[Candida] anglica]
MYPTYTTQKVNMYSKLFFYMVLFIFAPIVGRETYRTTLKNFEVLHVSTKSHHDSFVIQELSQAHDSLFPLAPYSASRKCISDSTITFHVHDIRLVYDELEASECRLNTNEKYLAIITPTPQIHLKIHEEFEPNLLHKEIEDNIIEKFSNFPALDLPYYDFEHLNYDLECSISYFDIAQVKLRQLSLEVTLDKSLKIAKSCGFRIIDPEFRGALTSVEKIKIPINGTFHCVDGRTPTCKRSIAQVSQAHYRFKDEF